MSSFHFHLQNFDNRSHEKKYIYITVRNIIRRASLVVQLKADIIAGNSMMSLVVQIYYFH